MRVEVDVNTDFEAMWYDERVPNMGWKLDQNSIEECEEVDGTYYATYEPLVVVEPKTVTYLTQTGTESFTLPLGTYGLRP